MFNLCVLINSLTIGGAEKLAVELYQEYKRKGIKVIFVCLEKNNFYSLESDSIYYLSDSNGENENFVQKFFALFVYAFKLKKLLKKKNISIVQSHIYRANYVNGLARLLGSSHKTQLVNHGIVSRYKGEGLAGRVNLFLIRHLYSRADQVVCPSQGMLDDMERLGAVPASGIVIHNPFDVDGILKAKDASPDPKVFRFDPDVQYLVAAGRLEKVKRYGDVIEALAILKKKGVSVELLLLGDGPEEGNLRKLAEKLGLKDLVHFTGRVANPFCYIARANILVSSSEFEGFSNVIVEALICGTPVVATDCPSGPREILAPGSVRRESLYGDIENAEFGVLVPVGNPETLAGGVEKLLSDTSLMDKYGSNGIRRARDFDLNVIVGKYISCMQNFMDA